MTDEFTAGIDMKEEERKTKEIEETKIEEPKKMTEGQEKEAEEIEKKHEEKIADAKASEDKIDNRKTKINRQQQTADELLTDKKSASEASQIKEKSKDKKETKKPQPKIKKSEVVVNAQNLPISTKYSAAICKFIKGKKIEDVIKELGEVIAKKKAVPMKGEYAHRKGPGKIASGSGKYPKKATENFIKLLKSLAANANNHGIDEPFVVEAVANIGKRPFGRFGQVKRKRTHVRIKAVEKKMIKKSKIKKKKKLPK